MNLNPKSDIPIPKYMASNNESRSVSIYINGNQADQTLKQLKATARTLTNEMANLVKGTQAYKDKVEELKSVNSKLQSIKDDVNGVSGAFGFLKTEIGKLGVLATGILGFQFLTEQIHNTITGNAKLSDSLADVQKSTGMSEMAVRRLSTSFKTLDTRTANKDLTDLAFVAGKLGISGERDVLGFVRAADQIGVTLGKAFGNTEEAINDIGKLVQVFKIKDTYGLEQALLKTGSAINDLGNAGTANEGYIVEFTKRMGGIAPAANMSIQNVMGLATVFDELGQPVEASATAIGKLMIMIGSDLPKYAKVAKMSVADFSKLLNTDGNAALVAVLKNVQGASGGIADLAAHMGLIGEDASRSITAIGALANNLDLLKTRQDLSNASFEKGTSLTDQFNIKNNNFGAMLDKLTKKINAIATNVSFTDFLVKATKATGDFIDFIARNISTIGMLVKMIIAGAVAYGTYNAVLLISNFNQKAWIASLLESEATTKLVILAETAYATVKLVLTGRIKEARQAMILFNATMDANPIGLVIAAIATLITTLYMFNNEVSDSVKTQQALNSISAESQKRMEEETLKLKALNKVRLDENESHDRRIKAVQKMNELYPGILKGLTDEEALTKKGTDAINEYVKALEKKSNAEAAQDKIKELQKKNIDLKYAPGSDDDLSLWQIINTHAATGYTLGKPYTEARDRVAAENKKKQIAGNEAIIKQIQVEYGSDIVNNELGAPQPATTTDKPKRTVQTIESEISALQTEQKQVSATSAEWAKYEQQIKKLQDEEEAITHKKGEAAGLSAAKKAEEERKKALADFKALAEEYKNFQAAELADTLAKNDKEVASVQLKYDKLIDKEKAFLTEKGVTDEQRTATNKNIADLEMQKNAQVTALKLKQEQELTNKIIALRNELQHRVESDYDQELSRINQFYDQQKQDAGANTDQLNEIEEARQKDLVDAKLREEQRFQDEKRRIAEDAMVIAGKTDDLEAARINKKYDDELARLKEKYSKEFQATKEFKDAVAALEGNRTNELNLEKAKKVKEFEISSAQEVSNAVFTIEENKRKAESDAILAGIETKRAAELANANLTEDQKQQINAKYDAQAKAEKLRAWKADKAAAVEQAIINGALAFVKALPNFYLGGAALVAAGAQVAVIESQDPPQFYHGGYSAVDYSRPQGFVKQPTLFTNSSSGRSFTAGEGYKTEYIVSSEQLKDPVVADFVNTMESNRGVRRFEQGGYSNATRKVSGKTAATTTVAPAIDLQPLLAEMQLTREAIRDQKVILQYQQFQRQMDKIATLKAASNARSNNK